MYTSCMARILFPFPTHPLSLVLLQPGHSTNQMSVSTLPAPMPCRSTSAATCNAQVLLFLCRVGGRGRQERAPSSPW